MRLNMHILKDALGKMAVEARCVPATDLSLKRMRPLDDAHLDNDRRHTVYYGMEEQLWNLDSLSRDAIDALVVVSDAPIAHLPLKAEADVIRVAAGGLPSAEDAMRKTFEQLSAWHDDLLEAIMLHADLQAIMDVGTRYIRNPIGLFSGTGKCITWSGEFPDGPYDAIWKSVFDDQVGFSPKAATICRRDNEWSSEELEVFHGTAEGMPPQCITANIFRTGNRGRRHCIGSLGGTQVWEPFTWGQASLLVEFAKRLGQNRTMVDYLHKRREHDIVFFTEYLLEGGEVPPRLLENALAVAGHEASTAFVVFVIDLETATLGGERIGKQSSLMITYLSRVQNNNTFSDIALLYEGKLVLVEALGRISRHAVEEKRLRLSKEFGALSFSMGASDVFHRFSAVRAHYRQAVAALDIGRIADQDGASYLFGDYLLEYLFEQSGARREPERYCHEMARALYRYDRQHHTDYLDFMECLYLHNGNKAKAAEELFIHRNTLSYRLEKVKSIVGVESLDYSDRLFFLASCRLVRWIEAAGRSEDDMR